MNSALNQLQQSYDYLTGQYNALKEENDQLKGTLAACAQTLKKYGHEVDTLQGRKWLSNSEAALYLGMSVRSLNRMRRRNSDFPAPSIKPDRSLAFNVDALEKFRRDHPAAFTTMRTQRRKTI